MVGQAASRIGRRRFAGVRQVDEVECRAVLRAEMCCTRERVVALCGEIGDCKDRVRGHGEVLSWCQAPSFRRRRGSRWQRDEEGARMRTARHGPTTLSSRESVHALMHSIECERRPVGRRPLPREALCPAVDGCAEGGESGPPGLGMCWRQLTTRLLRNRTRIGRRKKQRGQGKVSANKGGGHASSLGNEQSRSKQWPHASCQIEAAPFSNIRNRR